MTTTLVAFYRGRRRDNPDTRCWDRAICFFDRSPYSHVELALTPAPDENGRYLCLSSSPRDGGVRRKWMRLPADRWDILRVECDPAIANQFYERYRGRGYDWLGLGATLFACWPNTDERWFCSELVAAVLQLPNAARYGPRRLYQLLKEGGLQPS